MSAGTIAASPVTEKHDEAVTSPVEEKSASSFELALLMKQEVAGLKVVGPSHAAMSSRGQRSRCRSNPDVDKVQDKSLTHTASGLHHVICFLAACDCLECDVNSRCGHVTCNMFLVNNIVTRHTSTEATSGRRCRACPRRPQVQSLPAQGQPGRSSRLPDEAPARRRQLCLLLVEVCTCERQDSEPALLLLLEDLLGSR